MLCSCVGSNFYCYCLLGLCTYVGSNFDCYCLLMLCSYVGSNFDCSCLLVLCSYVGSNFDFYCLLVYVRVLVVTWFYWKVLLKFYFQLTLWRRLFRLGPLCWLAGTGTARLASCPPQWRRITMWPLSRVPIPMKTSLLTPWATAL